MSDQLPLPSKQYWAATRTLVHRGWQVALPVSGMSRDEFVEAENWCFETVGAFEHDWLYGGLLPALGATPEQVFMFAFKSESAMGRFWLRFSEFVVLDPTHRAELLTALDRIAAMD